ncbi:hypothetical protein [Cryobacterium sp. Y82]|uniref:hypothetical protein n=1 Tax=Cryobacterium sp. Y82 TaxID=2045017 RepID=UPI000CE3BF48|nr:hypothetical protein [Cryobacterium sp. Y82]
MHKSNKKTEIEEGAGGITSNYDDARRNLIKTLGSILRKPVLAVVIAGTMSLSFGGCAANGEKTDAEPLVTPTDAAQEPVTAFAFGDVVSLATVTDDLGTYTHMTISPEAEAMSLNTAIIDPTVAETGYTDADTLSAQKFIVTFSIEEVYDSSTIDTHRTVGWEAWKEKNREKYILESQVSILDNNDGVDRPSLINNNDLDRNPEFIRDGGARMQDATIDVTSITATDDPTWGKFFGFTMTGSADYRVTDAAAIAAAKMEFPDWSAEDLEAKLEADLLDNTGTNVWRTTYTLNFTVMKEDGRWKIGGYDNQFSSNGNLWIR